MHLRFNDDLLWQFIWLWNMTISLDENWLNIFLFLDKVILTIEGILMYLSRYLYKYSTTAGGASSMPRSDSTTIVLYSNKGRLADEIILPYAISDFKLIPWLVKVKLAHIMTHYTISS